MIFVHQSPRTHSHQSAGPIIIVFKPDDTENPITWSTVSQRASALPWPSLVKSRTKIDFYQAKKALIVVVGLCCIFNSVFGTSFPSGESQVIGAHFGVHDAVQLVLPITIYQCGFICGSLTFGPLSETSVTILTGHSVTLF